ncbi:ArsR/SmtB family transcription factor [Vibrio sonorensis]|uniref:ArsR/SmtB family transcription factor n=1 Tax=Vibrio sonorensis TaxID=1004316 RepID=UPI0008DA5DF2|nr:metalloregulator ArsR/SmtB family transcription factor [Vibrio sonorensis]
MSQCQVTDDSIFKTDANCIQQEEELAAKAKALSHPARVRILRILIAMDKANGCLNGDLVSKLGLAQSTVSEHLRILKQADFIISEPRPPKVCYRINRSEIHAFEKLLASTLN